MHVITLQEASKKLPFIVKETINNSEETSIVSKDGSVIMVDENHWGEIQETLRLLRDKKSLAALISGHEARDENAASGKTPNQVFHGL